MPVFSFQGFIPVIDPSSFIHETATIIGDVIIGKDCYIGPGAAIRGDWGQIVIENGCNIQENCTVHMFPGKSICLETGSHVGHGAVIHGANLKKNCLIGMNAVVMDDAEIGENSIVGALSFVKAEEKVPSNSLFVGNPGKVIKTLTDDMISWKTAGTEIYRLLPNECHASLMPVSPLLEIEKNRPTHSVNYSTWKEKK